MAARAVTAKLEQYYSENPGIGRVKLMRLSGASAGTTQRFLEKKKAAGESTTPPDAPPADTLAAQIEASGLNPAEVSAMLKSMQRPVATLTPKQYQWAGDSFKFAAITDTHFGHVKSHADWWLRTCDLIDRENCDMVLHAGDITEGMSGRQGHVYELEAVGVTAQVELAIQRFTLLPDIPIKAITGNHDAWAFRAVGVDIGATLDERLANYEHLGPDEADIAVNGVTIKLWHGGDGSSYACHDDQTEIMTPTGWVKFAALQQGEPVATLNPETHEFEWQEPTAHTAKPYKGELLHFKARCMDMMLTPNHRMYVRRYPVDLEKKRKTTLTHPTKSHGQVDLSWQFIRADEVSNGYRQQWQTTKKVDGWHGEVCDVVHIPHRESKNNGVKVKHLGELDVKDVAELMAWYVTEGHIRGKGSLTIAQYEDVNPENCAKIWALVQRIGLEPKWSSTKKKKDIRVGSMELCEYLLAECGHMSRHKFLPTWLKDQHVDVLRVVFDTMVAGDGWLKQNGYGYRSISKQLAEDFAEVAIKLGYGVTFCKNTETVTVSQTQVMPTINAKPVQTHYDGMVYCVTVPNGIIMTRRNGKTTWGGNTSYRTQKFVEGLTGGEKPHILISGHAHKAIFHECRNVMVFEGGTLCGQTSWMRGKKLAAHCGFWIVEVFPAESGGIERITSQWIPFFKE